MMKGDAPSFTPDFVLEGMKHHAVPWWLTTEDLPDPENRVTLHNATPLSVEAVNQVWLAPTLRGHRPHERVRARDKCLAWKDSALLYAKQRRVLRAA